MAFKTGDAKSVELTLDPAVTAGDTGITVGYTKPSSKPLQDTSSNAVASFSGQQVTNVTGDTTAPTLRWASVNERVLTLNFNEALTATNAPDPSRFTVAGTDLATTVVSVSFKSGDANSVELSLSPAVAAGETGVTVSYTKGSDANPLQDLAGNEAANFSGQHVSNQTGILDPRLLEATVDGSTLTLTFYRPLKTTSAPGTSRFTVAGTASTTSVTAVGFKSGDANSVELTLSPAVPASDSGIRMSYAKGTDANPLQGVAGHEVVDFSGQQVKNKTPPAVQSATVDGSSLTLTFNKALKTTHAPATSRFTVAGTASTTTVTAVAFKSGDAKSVELILSPAVAGGDTGITVSYAKGNDTNPLQDAAGNEVVDFSGQQVTNLTGTPTVQSATVVGTTLTLTFNAALKTTNAPATSRFTVAGTASATTVTAVGFKSRRREVGGADPEPCRALHRHPRSR